MSSKKEIKRSPKKNDKIRRSSPKRNKRMMIGGYNYADIDINKPKLLDHDITGDGIKWKKLGSDGSEYLELYLKKNDKIIADKHSLVTMTTGIESVSKMGSFIKGIARSFAGEYSFMTHFTGLSSTPQKITLSLPANGDIIHLRLRNGEEWKLSKFVFLASTSNVEISATLNVRGLVSEEGIALTSIKAINGDADIWLSAYGHVEKHELNNNEDILIKPGNFLAAPISCSHTVEKNNSIIGALSGSDLFAIKFKGPCVVYTHSGNVQSFITLLKEHGLRTYNVNINKNGDYDYDN